MIGKHSQLLEKIEEQRAKNKKLRDRINKLKEAKRHRIESEKSNKEAKETETSNFLDINPNIGIVLEAHLNRSKRMLNNFQRLFKQFTEIGDKICNQDSIGRLKETSITQTGNLS